MQPEDIMRGRCLVQYIMCPKVENQRTHMHTRTQARAHTHTQTHTHTHTQTQTGSEGVIVKLFPVVTFPSCSVTLNQCVCVCVCVCTKLQSVSLHTSHQHTISTSAPETPQQHSKRNTTQNIWKPQHFTNTWAGKSPAGGLCSGYELSPSIKFFLMSVTFRIPRTDFYGWVLCKRQLILLYCLTAATQLALVTHFFCWPSNQFILSYWPIIIITLLQNVSILSLSYFFAMIKTNACASHTEVLTLQDVKLQIQ